MNLESFSDPGIAAAVLDIHQRWTDLDLEKATPRKFDRRNERRRRSRDQETSSSMPQRGLTRSEVAALAGLSPSGFDKARRDGLYPEPTLPGGRWDRKLIEITMGRASDLVDCVTPDSALDAWRKRSGSR